MALADDQGDAVGPRADPYLLGRALRDLDAGVYALDGAGTIVGVNPRAEELLRRPAAELIGQDAHDLLHRTEHGRPIQRSTCRLLEALLGGETRFSAPEWFECGDGSLLTASCLTAPIDVGGETGGAVIFLDAPVATRNGEPPPEADVKGRLAMIAETTTVLSFSLDPDTALRSLVRLMVPRLADWAVVDLVAESGQVRRVAVVRYHLGRYIDMDEFSGPLPPVADDSRTPLARVLRGGAPVLVAQEEEPDESELAARQRAFYEAVGMRSAVIAPLRALGGVQGRVIGALTVGRTELARPYGSSELSLVDDIARRAALAVDNAQLYEGQRRVAENMQRHLLPPMPKILGLEACARYEPAAHASKVGGDWYDVFPLPDGSVAMVIGDVVGHDLAAAAHMSQVRNMLRAFAWHEELSPSAAVERLDSALAYISDAPMATLVLARIEGPEGGPWQLRWTNAGHPPPLVVRHDGRTEFLEGGESVLLGTDMPLPRSDAVTALPPLSTVVLYTDGLIETRSGTLDDGLRRLGEHASALAEQPLEIFCDRLLELMRPTDNQDDIALIALRPRPVPGTEPGLRKQQRAADRA